MPPSYPASLRRAVPHLLQRALRLHSRLLWLCRLLQLPADPCHHRDQAGTAAALPAVRGGRRRQHSRHGRGSRGRQWRGVDQPWPAGVSVGPSRPAAARPAAGSARQLQEGMLMPLRIGHAALLSAGQPCQEPAACRAAHSCGLTSMLACSSHHRPAAGAAAQPAQLPALRRGAGAGPRCGLAHRNLPSPQLPPPPACGGRGR